MSVFCMDPSDVVASEGGRTQGTLVSPPQGWPACFKENPKLKALMGKKSLAGKRCRLTGTPSADDTGKAAAVSLNHEDSFGNALAVQEALGWEVIKGFAVFSLAEAPTEAFVAHKRWWNAKESGVWVDLTPRPDGFDQVVLLESALSEKSKETMTDARCANAMPPPPHHPHTRAHGRSCPTLRAPRHLPVRLRRRAAAAKRRDTERLFAGELSEASAELDYGDTRLFGFRPQPHVVAVLRAGGAVRSVMLFQMALDQGTVGDDQIAVP